MRVVAEEFFPDRPVSAGLQPLPEVPDGRKVGKRLGKAGNFLNESRSALAVPGPD